MSEQNPGKAEVLIVHHPAGMYHGCKRCGKVHVQGQYAVGLDIVEDGKNHRYMVGFDPPIRCCGERKPFFQVFATEIEAGVLCADVTKHLNERGTTTGLNLIGYRHPTN